MNNNTLPCRVAWLSCCAFKLNMCFQLLTWLMGMRWLESKWALSCHHVQNPRYGYVYAVWKCMISFTRSGHWRSRCLTLNKFRDPQLEPLAVFKSLESCPCVSRSMGYWKVLCRSQFILCCPSLAWVLVPSLRRFGKSETTFSPSSPGTTSRTHKSLIQLRLPHYFVRALNLPFHSWWANFAKLCIIFILLYVFGKWVKLRI